MPTTIRLNVPESAESRRARQRADDALLRGNLLFAPVVDARGDGIAQLKEISGAEARVILSDLRTQLRGRNGTKSGYLKLMHTSRMGRDQMVIERKSRLQTWFSREGKMARSGQAILDLLRKSGAASPQQLRDLETYLGRRGMAGTRAVAELLNRIDLDADPYEAIGSEACQKRGDVILNAWQAAGLAPSDDLQNFIRQWAGAAPLSAQLNFELLALLMRTQPRPTAAQAGMIIRALVDSDDPRNPACSLVIVGAMLHHYHAYLVQSSQPEGGSSAAQAQGQPRASDLTAEQHDEFIADLLLETTRGREHWLAALLQSFSHRGSVADVPTMVKRLRQSIEARNPPIANATDILRSLSTAHGVDLTLDTRLSLENQAWDEQTRTQAEQAQQQRGYVQVAISVPDQNQGAAEPIGAADHSAEQDPSSEPEARQAEASGRAAALLRDFLSQSAAQGMTVSGNFSDVSLGSPQPLTQYRMVNSLIRLTPDISAQNGAVPPAVPQINLSQSSIQHSAITLVSEDDLSVNLQQARLDGSVVALDLHANSGLQVSGLNTASLEGTSIVLADRTLHEQLVQLRPNDRVSTLVNLFIGFPGERIAPRVDITGIIAQLPERYATLKASLFLQVLEEVLRGQPFVALDFAARALRVEPRLLTNPAVKKSVDQVVHQIAERVWAGRGTPAQALARYAQLYDGVPALKQLLDEHPDYVRLQQLRQAEVDPRGCRDNLEPVFRALTSLGETYRQRWMRDNLGATHILLHRAADAANPDWDADGALRNTLMNSLVEVPVVARALDFYMQDIYFEVLSDDPSGRREQRIRQYYEQQGTIPFGRSGSHFALLSRGVVEAIIQRQPIDGFFTQQDAMLTIDQGAQTNAAITENHQRAFHRFKDAGLDPVLREAVNVRRTHILSRPPDAQFPANVHTRLAERHSQANENQSLSAAELDALGDYMQGIRAPGVQDPLQSFPNWGRPVLSDQHLQNLRTLMVDADIPDTDANFSGYLMALASVYARLSSASGFGTESDSVLSLRGYAHALLSHAKLMGNSFAGSDRRIPDAPLMDALAQLLRSTQCSAIISADYMLPATRSHAPEIFDWLIPAGWLRLGRDTDGLRRLRNEVAPDPVPVQ